jgi:hypothetical protein
MSDEATLQLVNFIHNLSLALESIYFDQMLCHTSRNQTNPFDSGDDSQSNIPF